MHTKPSIPLDIEFTIQDTFAATRPQWKFASNLEEATKAFQLAISQDQKNAGADKAIEVDDASSEGSSSGDADDVEQDVDGDDDSAGSEDEDAEVGHGTL